jgi:rubrerythrin
MVLLCYENVVKGERCHRRMFAAWWEKRTGEEVPELAPAQQELL